MYVSVCADLNQTEEFFPPTTTENPEIEILLRNFVLHMHDPVATLVQGGSWVISYIHNEFVVHNNVWAKFIFNPDIDFYTVPVAYNFNEEVSIASSEGRPYTVTFTNDAGKTLDLNFYLGTEKMDEIYTKWDRETNPSRYDELGWV